MVLKTRPGQTPQGPIASRFRRFSAGLPAAILPRRARLSHCFFNPQLAPETCHDGVGTPGRFGTQATCATRRKPPGGKTLNPTARAGVRPEMFTRARPRIRRPPAASLTR